MQPLRNPQLKPIPAALGLKPRFWSSFTFMCKWVYFDVRKQERMLFERSFDNFRWAPIREPQPVRFVGPHPRVRQHAARMFGELPIEVLHGALSGLSPKVSP